MVGLFSAPRFIKPKGAFTLQRRQFTEEFKTRVAREAIQAGNACATARRYEIHPTVVRRWIQRYKEEGTSAFDGRRRGRSELNAQQELQQVVRENEQLKRLLGEKDLENAILRDLVKKGPRH